MKLEDIYNELEKLEEENKHGSPERAYMFKLIRKNLRAAVINQTRAFENANTPVIQLNNITMKAMAWNEIAKVIIERNLEVNNYDDV